MRITQIRQILEIEKCGSITQAARNLYIAQPSLSAVLSDFEDEIGVKLFHRNKNGISVTTEGEEILPAMKEIMDNVNYIKTYNNEKEDASITGSVRLILGPAIEFLYAEFLENTKRRFPKANLQISNSVNYTVLNDLNRSAIDFSVSSVETVSGQNMSETDLTSQISAHYPNISYLPLKYAHTIAIYNPTFFPNLGNDFFLEDYCNVQFISGKQYTDRFLNTFLSLEKYPLTNLDWTTTQNLLQRIPSIGLDCTPLNISQYMELSNLEQQGLRAIPVTTNIQEMKKDLSWPLFLLYHKNNKRQLQSGIFQEIRLLLEQYDLIV